MWSAKNHHPAAMRAKNRSPKSRERSGIEAGHAVSMYGNQGRGRGRTRPERGEDGHAELKGGSCEEIWSRSKNREAYNLWWRSGPSMSPGKLNVGTAAILVACHRSREKPNVPGSLPDSLLYMQHTLTHLRLYFTSATNPKSKPPESQSMPSRAPFPSLLILPRSI